MLWGANIAGFEKVADAMMAQGSANLILEIQRDLRLRPRVPFCIKKIERKHRKNNEKLQCTKKNITFFANETRQKENRLSRGTV